ncbi:hypothetical protein IBD57_002641 [Salmonella enterica]|nr:hypothetical protein [Salmonella enterica]
MLIVNALRYAEHSRAGHYIAGRTNHRFVRYITASTTCKIVVRHWRLEPSTTLITDFTGAFPATGLARLPQCQSGRWREIGFSPTVTVFKGVWNKDLNLGKQKFCAINRLFGKDDSPAEKIRCHVAVDAAGNWTLTQNPVVGFSFCDAVCFK